MNNMISNLFNMESKRILGTKDFDENTRTTLVFKIFESLERKLSWRNKSRRETQTLCRTYEDHLERNLEENLEFA